MQDIKINNMYVHAHIHIHITYYILHIYTYIYIYNIHNEVMEKVCEEASWIEKGKEFYVSREKEKQVGSSSWDTHLELSPGAAGANNILSFCSSGDAWARNMPSSSAASS